VATLLSQAFREQVKQTKDISQKNEMSYSISYPTGFMNLDFANGYIQEVNGQLKYELGISDGSINMIISDSGVGKTTLCTQIAANIVKRFPTSVVFYEQAEVGTNIQRIKNVSGISSDEEFSKKFVIRDAGITIESIYERVKMVHDIKVANQSDYLYDTGLIDMRGNPIHKFEPTVFIVDSIKMVLSKKNAEADETNNMAAATNAKANSEYYTKMVPLCREANIIMLLINHITMDINTGFLPKKSELAYLKQGEHISGGKSLTYIQNNIFRLDIKSKLKPEEGFGITGSVVNVDIVKSRTNKSSRARCFMVFNQEIGYDSDLSMLLLLKENKILEGSGAYLKLPGYDKKFSQKQFKNILYTDQEFYNTFVNVCLEYLKNGLLEEYNRIKEEESLKLKYKNPYEAILAQLN
jgi:RecA/RadA recombinase